MANLSQPGAHAPVDDADLQALVEASFPRGRPESARALASTAHTRHVAADETIFSQGEQVPPTLVMRGYGAFRRTTVDGQQLIVGIANPGEIYGISGLSLTISSVDMVALTDCVVASWRGNDVRNIAATDPDLAMDVIDRLALFLNILTEKLDGFLHQDARRRVIRVLARHRDLFFSDPPVLSRGHLPGLVGTSREMTGRVLRQLEREGSVTRVGRAGLRLLDPELLDSAEARQAGA
jgi:CRP-like cAMP-binding protein